MTKKTKNLVTITERGWPAHYICVDHCRFRRNTLVECGGRRFVVSTVGAMRNCEDTIWEKIGAGRYFETMVFKAKQSEPYGYWDADIERSVSGWKGRWCITEPPRFESDKEANAMHEAIVAELKAKLEKGAQIK